jgi:hypothetical protein
LGSDYRSTRSLLGGRRPGALLEVNKGEGFGRGLDDLGFGWTGESLGLFGWV